MPDAPNTIGDAGYMTEEGNPSVPGAHYFNAQIKEFENALAAAGIAFDRTKYDHFTKSIISLATTSAMDSLIGVPLPYSIVGASRPCVLM